MAVPKGEFAVLSGLGVRKNERMIFYLVLARESVGKVVLQSKELCL